ncbi:phenol hydroxylase subunit [Rhodoblastus sp.]|uniref:phenol hydroxylase subunit n=1 Tax=Rhodoblastus sp. TaxID=1962975 RepID=UPI003F9529DF
MGRQDSGATPTGARADAAMRKYVRVTGARLDKYVEFEFSVNDADLTVELILPFAAFDEFCRLQNVTVLPPEPAAAARLEQLAWRSRQPGLLRRVKNNAEEGHADDAPAPGAAETPLNN